MAKSVMISIRPEWVQKILSGEKTVEVRKTAPKIATPFKCYIYCTKPRVGKKYEYDAFGLNGKPVECVGTVVAEFICDKVECFGVPYPAYSSKMRKDIMEQSCLTYTELHQYAKHDHLYSWHISNLKVYDEPKELCEFTKYAVMIHCKSRMLLP